MKSKPPVSKKHRKVLKNSQYPLVVQKILFFGNFLILSLIFIFIKIGQIPIKILSLSVSFWRVIETRISLLGKILESVVNSFPRMTLPLPKHKHHRGRPKKKVGFAVYQQRLVKKILRIIPKSLRYRIAVGLIALVVITYSVILIRVVSVLPSPQQFSANARPLTTSILDRNGKVLYQIYEGQNRQLVKLEDVPTNLINATIASEDKNFFNHPGVDIEGIIRAAKATFIDGRIEGGSTITQQLVKNILLTPEQTLQRKTKEALLAFWLERNFSKKEILQMYFNEAPYGGPAWGAESAAKMYFGKSVSGLNLAESAYLAGLPALPSEYSPYGSHPEKGKQRQLEVLRSMVDQGYITQNQSQEAYEKQLTFRPPTTDIKAPHFVMYVRALLASKYGEKVISQGGLKITTSLDLDIQQMAENVVAKQLDQLSNLKVGNGAAMVTEAYTGQVLAMVGSKDYFDPSGGNYNAAITLRQPGSSIKPVTYATAFKQGFTPGTIILDTPTTFLNPWGPGYSPVNYDGRFHGAVTIRTALGSSYNIPAVKILGMIGLPAMIETAKDLGITTFTDVQNYGLSLTLGGGAVRLIDMMSAYGTFAQKGVRVDPQPILTITDASGNLIEDNTHTDGRRVLTEEVAYLVNDILSDNNARAPAFGPNSLLVIPNHKVAVKTGTSDDKRDNWTFGFTPKYVVGVWVGNNNNSPMDPQLTSGITGAAPIWHDIMTSLLVDEPSLAFTKPAGIVTATVGGHSDLAISGQVPKVVVGYKKSKTKDEATGEEKEVITYTDPFSIYIPDQIKTTQ